MRWRRPEWAVLLIGAPLLYQLGVGVWFAFVPNGDFVTIRDAGRWWGAATIVAVALAMSILWFPFRKGERWSWWALWSIGGWWAYVIVYSTLDLPSQYTVEDWFYQESIALAGIVLTAAGLLLGQPTVPTPAPPPA